jgi:hypothetical protein
VVSQVAASYAVYKAHAVLRCRRTESLALAAEQLRCGLDPWKKHYLLYGSERYALVISRPLQAAIRARARGRVVFRRAGRRGTPSGQTYLPSTEAVREFGPIAVLTSSNAVPHFFPGVKVEVFHGFDAGNRGTSMSAASSTCTATGPRDTQASKKRRASSVISR